jgi:hypothetical protein
MSGVLSINMPGFLQGVNYLSPMSYVTRNLVPYSLRHMTFTCTAEQRLPDGSCPITTGKQVLDLYALDTNPAINIMALGICTLVYRLLAYALLKGMRMHWGGNKIRKAGRPNANPGAVA